jgi:Zn-dependent peptidase ImmA (M78 family)
MTRQKLNPARKRELIALAEEVASLYSPGKGSVDLEVIIRDSDIDVHYDDYEDAFHGALEVSGEEFHIHINTSRCGPKDSVRSRFTKGHELGHFFIDEHRLALLSGHDPHGSTCGMFDSAETPEELEADFFAANLLMPPLRFIKQVRENESPLKAIERISKYFKTSITATALHYITNAANRCAIIRWTDECEFAWNFVGNGYHASHFHKPFYADGMQPIKDSATDEVLSGREKQSESVSTTAMAFKGVASGGNRDLLLKEESLSLGNYGFMTIFSDLP